MGSVGEEDEQHANSANSDNYRSTKAAASPVTVLIDRLEQAYEVVWRDPLPGSA
jgi:hypothetical protein